jgi:ribosomal protein S18 acetylase RimI-like enzyme
MVAVASISYVKRYKMEVGLEPLPAAVLPPGFAAVPWNDGLVECHAEVLFGSFQGEIDAHVFPSLGDRAGCSCLMLEIRRRWGFVAGATWLLAGPGGAPCGTVQGVREHSGLGAIQNLGILPAWRGRGLGEALLLYALHGFRAAGLGRATLEVTAQNDAAVRLYRRLGFHRRKILYKAVPDPRAVFPPALL